MSPRRAIRVEEWTAAAPAGAAAIAAAFAPPAPTGRPIIDAALLALTVGIAVYASASVPWWFIVIAAGTAIGVAGTAALTAMASVALILGLWVGIRRRSTPEWRAVSVGISLNILAWAELGGFFGLSSIVGITVGVLIFVLGMRRRPRQVRRVATTIVAMTAAVAVLAVIGFGLEAARVRSDVESAELRVERGIALINDGEYAAAADEFESASHALDRAEQRLTGPLASGASIIPVFAQHRAFASDLTETGASATGRVAAALRLVDTDALRLVGASVNLEAVSSLEEPFAEVDSALDDLAAAVDSTQSPWLITEFREKLASLGDDIAENSPRVENLRDATALLPDMLGASGPRGYLVLFTTPAEARGLGGFVGNYAELTIDEGRVQMTDFGRVNTLESQALELGVRIDGPDGFLTRYGQFGFNTDGNGLVSNATFRNLTMTPNFPWVGAVASDVYTQVTGRSIHGVMAMDPYVLAALLEYSGPIELTEVPFTLTSDNAADFLLRGQYTITQDTATRLDALDEAGRQTFDALLRVGLPNPTDVAEDLAPLVDERRLLVWTADEAEQDLLRRIGLLGEIPPHGSADGWSFTVNNAGGSKIDSFLERSATYGSRVDATTGETVGTLQVTLTNTAPTEGLPPYVIGNAVGLPQGTSRLWVSFYSVLPLTSATRDGEPTDLSAGAEQGWNVYSRYVNIPSGASVSFELQFRGTLEQPDTVVTWTQPLALPLRPN